MLKNIEAVIFDLDGTLIDSMGVWKQIDKDFLSMRNIPFPENLQKEIEGMCFKDTALYFIKRFNLCDTPAELEEIWHKMAEDKYENEILLKKGAEKFIVILKEHNIKLGIATSNSRRLTELFLKSHNLYSKFDYILTGGDTLKSKPSPDIYLLAAEKLGVLPENCLVFEDIVPGIMAGKNAGMKVCAIDDRYSNNTIDEKIELADYFIYSYEDILIDEVLQ